MSLTHTNGLCSGVITPGLGFLQNNYMIAFDPKPGGPNSIEPGKKRTTGASPCIVYRDGKPFMVVGAPGGAYIIGAVLQTILNVIDHGMTAVEAVSPASRLPGRYGIRGGKGARLGVRRAESRRPPGAARYFVVRPLPQPAPPACRP